MELLNQVFQKIDVTNWQSLIDLIMEVSDCW